MEKQKGAAKVGTERGAGKIQSLFDDLKTNKAFPRNSGEDRSHFSERSHIEASQVEMTARIEKDHDRPGWW